MHLCNFLYSYEYKIVFLFHNNKNILKLIQKSENKKKKINIIYVYTIYYNKSMKKHVYRINDQINELFHPFLNNQSAFSINNMNNNHLNKE